MLVLHVEKGNARTLARKVGDDGSAYAGSAAGDEDDSFFETGISGVLGIFHFVWLPGLFKLFVKDSMSGPDRRANQANIHHKNFHRHGWLNKDEEDQNSGGKTHGDWLVEGRAQLYAAQEKARRAAQDRPWKRDKNKPGKQAITGSEKRPKEIEPSSPIYWYLILYPDIHAALLRCILVYRPSTLRGTVPRRFPLFRTGHYTCTGKSFQAVAKMRTENDRQKTRRRCARMKAQTSRAWCARQ